ncbi:MAG TPA: glycoside hydrolase family 172 protein [Acidimicrobiales bacterium]|nr:glycoside hydrolase family 172 protein [Acidimicrobiales bacterium]
MFDAHDLTRVPKGVESRAVTFENPTGARGAGGTVANGRKGAPFQLIDAGERVVLAEIDGPGVIRHIWMTFPLAPPEIMRAKLIEVFYDGASEPSISVPAMDFFGVPFGRPVALDSALVSIGEGRGYNSFIPMPFKRSVRIEYVNASTRRSPLYYQVDYTLEPDLADDATYLHATYRRENPTTRMQDFVISDGLRGPGRFLGCVVGVRVIDGMVWYGEGEVKMFIDGDTSLPTICGTGLEDYVGTAWGMGPHQSLYMGAPLDVRGPGVAPGANPDFVGFYRWHVPDPVFFADSLKVTIQQIGADLFLAGMEEQMAKAEVAGTGWMKFANAPGILGFGICERSDDYCATAFVMCAQPQPVARVQLDDAIADIERRDYEDRLPMENDMLSELDPESLKP